MCVRARAYVEVRGQHLEVSSLLLWGPQGKTEVVRLGSKQLHSLSYLAGPSFSLFIMYEKMYFQ